MKRFALAMVLSLCGVACSQRASVSPAATVDEVRIGSRWDGLSPDSPLVTELFIKRTGARYTMTGTHGVARKIAVMAPVPVSADDVARLVAALKAPSQSRFAVADLGVAETEVQRRIDSEMKPEDESARLPRIDARMQAYRNSLRQRVGLETALTTGFRSFHTDDYPSVRVEAMLSDGSTIVASSESQHHLMLPWKRKGSQATYASTISESLWRLLPGDATNKDRLHGPIDDSGLDELVRAALFEGSSRVSAEATAGNALRVLETHFEVESVVLQEPTAGLMEENSLFATLRLPDGPENLAMQVRLPLKGDALEDPEGGVARIDAALSLAQSAPGLASTMLAHVEEEFRMYDRFGSAWLDERTARQFLEQMKQLGKLRELTSDSESLQGAVMVTEGDSPIYWIVLADRRAVLWKKYTDAAATAGTSRCESVPANHEMDETSNGRKDDLCIGRIYSSEGRELR